mmetsp:Transcript_33163/g.74911  ORF Transcript_33163/g.74911 Transcript_33163/m.74911 type:complete len:223 (+) Transcript_33163:758-1426(+)
MSSEPAACARSASRPTSTGSSWCIFLSWSSPRNFTSQIPGGSRIPPRDSLSQYISITLELMVGSMTTQAPPRSSPLGGMYTWTGCSYSTRASTIMAPNLRISPAMSRVPPLNPRQLAKMMSGRFSPRPKSWIAWAVLYALSGYHTCPAWGCRASREAGLAGSAGMRCSTSRVSTEMTPMGMPPRRARPTTTDLPQSGRYSVKEPLSKKPLTHPCGVSCPASM